MLGEPRKRLARQMMLAQVPRWCCVRTIQKQSVSEHVHRVVAWVDYLLDLHEKHDDAEFRNHVMVEALRHDDEESWTGDRPSNSKQRNYAHLIAEKGQPYVIVKVADILEALCFIWEDLDLGNIRLGGVEQDLMDKLKQVAPSFSFKRLVEGDEAVATLVAMARAVTTSPLPVFENG